MPSQMTGTKVTQVRMWLPLIPPSVNHYKMRTRRGVTFVSKEAKDFKAHIWAARPKDTLCECDGYEVDILIVLGKGQKGDVDNFAKCVLDGLVEAAVIYSDAAVQKLTISKTRDAAPRTEITVRAIG